jgi:membrane dipeptidase
VQDVQRVTDLARGECILVEEAGRARLLGAPDVVVVAGAGVDDDVLLRIQCADEARRLDTVAAGHREVHQDDVRPVLARELDRFVAGPRAADDLEAAVLGQLRRDQFGKLVVVLGDDDAQQFGLHSAERDISDPYDAAGAAPVILDGHNDVLLRLWRGEQLVHLDPTTAPEAGFAGGFFALFAPSGPSPADHDVDVYSLPPPGALSRAEAVGIVEAQLALLGSLGLPTARRAGDFAAGSVTAIVHMEGCEALAPDLSDLEEWYARGLRSLGPVWSRPNDFGAGVPFAFPSSPDTGPGLSAAGKRLVHACNRLGIVVDLSHLNEAGFWDVASASLVPLVATHSSAHALCASSRNLTDAQLDAIGASEGVVGINFCPAFLREDGADDPATPISEIVRHLDYVADRIGVDHVAFGSDFEGATMPAELGGAAGLPKLVGLLRDRYGDDEVEKITHRNWLRVLEATWNLWGRYFALAGDDPRPTLVDAASRFEEPGFAVDLGAGTGRDSAELLRRGWRVLAIDRELEALDRLRAIDGPPRLEVRHARFEDAEWPPCDLVNASFALPFCRAAAFPAVWAKIAASLRPGGRFCGQLFGDHDDWAGSGVVVQTRDELADLLIPFEVERLDEVDEDGSTAVGTRKHWHVYHLVARRL